ncbi:hypothetical protein ACHAW5_008078 [Stephanodiscus triporus]|uniref:Uncharacterized protein n=1 Tax=Stephanodiscus triporus TaxID=2934178 RepID=A0ABD3PV59_9STRA
MCACPRVGRYYVQGRRDLANSPPTQNNNNLSDASSRPSSPTIDHPFVPREEDRRGDGRIGAGRSLADDDVVPRQESRSRSSSSSSSSRGWHRVLKDAPLGRGGRGLEAIVTTLVRGAAVDQVVWARMLPSRSTDTPRAVGEALGSSPLIEAIEAIDSTRSLDVPGAIRYWVLLLAPDDDDDDDETGGASRRRAAVLKGMKGVVRDAGGTWHDDEDDCTYDAIDPRVAISFVVLVEGRRPSPSPSWTSGGTTLLPDFGPFHESFLDLEDRLLDECDEYWVDNEAGELGEEEEDDGNGGPGH